MFLLQVFVSLRETHGSCFVYLLIWTCHYSVYGLNIHSLAYKNCLTKISREYFSFNMSYQRHFSKLNFQFKVMSRSFNEIEVFMNWIANIFSYIISSIRSFHPGKNCILLTPATSMMSKIKSISMILFIQYILTIIDSDFSFFIMNWVDEKNLSGGRG